ncbi:MAG: hypothetical protein ACRBG0_05640 [Lewinella sp.]|jgi:hypothetical protein|uniref:hypothetical protein n=1 Tax=Lewinella sp. TaxID=2004506 RepID=UPI003D6B27B9
MKSINFLLVFSFFMLLQGSSACNQAKDTPIIDPELLLNCWTHVHEEVLEEGRYFQPCDFSELPASRYRATYDLQEGGVCTYMVLAPNDAHYSLTGTWEYDAKNAQLKVYDADQILVADLEVLELTENRLIVSP